MRVTRLEIFGFKSFMDRLTLPLTGGVTGVVGPNGCGKSNIVDALKWVLGETNARNLRGSISEDIIFNGTEALRPLGLAEVTLTLRAAGESFVGDLVSDALEAEEIAESAALDVDENEASGEELLSASLENPDDTLSDQTVGSEEPSARPRLTVIEGNLDKPKEAAEESPPAVESPAVGNTVGSRFAWLKSVNEVQITRRLYRSGESEYFINRVPCRLKDLVELLRAVGLGPRTYTVVAQGQVSRIISAKPEERRLILEEAAGVVGFRDKIATTTRRLKETELGLSRINDIIKEVSRQVASLKRQASRAENREELRSELKRLERAVFADQIYRIGTDLKERRETLARHKLAEESALAAVQRVQAEEEEARSSLIALDVESDRIRAEIDQIREELSNREHQRSSRAARVVELKAITSSKTVELERLSEGLKDLSGRKELAAQGLESLESKERELAEAVLNLEAGGDEKLREAGAAVRDAARALEDERKELQKLRAQALENEVLQRSIREQLLAFAPPFEGESRQLFIDGLEVPEKYRQALQALLGESGGFALEDDPYAAAGLLGEQDTARSIGVVRKGSGSLNVDPSGLPAGIFHTLSVISVSEECSLAAGHLLKSSYVAESVESALNFLEQLSSSEKERARVATLNGAVFTAHTVAKMASNGAIRLKSRLDLLQEESGKIADSIAQRESTIEDLKVRHQSAEKAQSVALEESEKRALEVRGLSQELGAARGRLGAERSAVSQIESDLRKAHQQKELIERLILENRAEHERLSGEMVSDQAVDEDSLRERIVALSSDLHEVTARRDKDREALSTKSGSLNESRNALDAARAELSGLNLDIQKQEMEFQHINERILENLGDDALIELKSSDASCLLEDELRLSYREDIERIKRRIEREGEVDSSSIEKFREESLRLEELEKQHKDLSQAAETLKRTIKRLSKISETKFVTTFEAVNQNFSELIPRLFGGGSGRLELLDPAHPLESGVEIVARPPGKKLKSIELMSGGEKALCAISLIVSMFLQRPSPLCVLDEVDAPLDDANVNRFLTLVKEMSSKTQFLMITHNKQSMAISDQLVGVTMEKPGASTVVTVSLQEASRYAANT